MPGMLSDIHVKGAKELDRAFRQLGKEVVLEMRPELRRIAENVRIDAEHQAVSEISHIGRTWSQMRVGVTVKGAYVVPKQRGIKGDDPRKRPKLVGLMNERVMDPVLAMHEPRITREFEALVAATAMKNRFRVI